MGMEVRGEETRARYAFGDEENMSRQRSGVRKLEHGLG